MIDIPWQARVKLFDSDRAKDVVGSVEECVQACRALGNAGKLDVMMESDEPLPTDEIGGKMTMQVGSAELEWLATKLPY